MQYSEKTEKPEFSVAIPASLNRDVNTHLLKQAGKEDVAFALYKPSLGASRFTSLVHKIIFPLEGERIIGSIGVEIKPEYFKRVCKIAMEEKSGVILMHSHLGPGWQGMSAPDFLTERQYSSPSFSLTEMPFVGLTLGTDGTWSARIWEYNNEWYERKSASAVRVVGKSMNVYFNDNLRIKPEFKEIYKRTVTVWGKKNHETLARLKVGIVGLGSVGSMVAEMLARMGVERVVLMDFDEVQIHNLDRLLGATVRDIGHLKIQVAERQYMKSSTATRCEIRLVPHGVTEKEGYLEALDCDVIFSCVDRPWPRHVLNHLAYNHLIPVIDGGIRIKFLEGTEEFAGADWQLQTVSPERICLSCLGVYQPADAQTEQAGLLEDPTYLAGLPKDSHFKNNENVFPFSNNLASLEVLQFIELVTSIGNDGATEPQRYSYNEGYIRLLGDKQCMDECLFKEGVAMGDSLFPRPTGFDHAATKARERQDKLI
ncbi:MAG: ThiF family adenylyltransferase [Verrucomicrobia bacterium]|nr:ThiF family adenylyltransferase [Verrucomicrobiota bacterium]